MGCETSVTIYVERALPALAVYATGDELQELEVEVVGNYTEGTPDRPYLSNGDPGYPGDPAEFEPVEASSNDAFLVPGFPVGCREFGIEDLTDEELEEAVEKFWDSGCDPAYDAYEEYMENERKRRSEDEI